MLNFRVYVASEILVLLRTTSEYVVEGVACRFGVTAARIEDFIERTVQRCKNQTRTARAGVWETGKVRTRSQGTSVACSLD